MKRFLVIFICCTPLVLSPAISFALDSSIVTEQDAPVYKKYGPIRYYESLWSVSKKLRPNRLVSLQQTLVAIYKLNPDAFFAGDINHLIKNSVINVPTDSFIKKQTNQDAINLINQYADKNKTAKRTVLAAKSTKGPITKSPSVSEPQAVAIVDAGQQSLTASLIDKKYLPDPKASANHLSVGADPASQSGNDQQNNSEADNVKNALSQQAGSQSLIKIQVLQSELNSVNEQLVATTKTNEEFKSKLQLLIDEMDLLKHKMDAESAAELTLLKLLEQYNLESNSARQPVINSAGVNAQKGAWISALSRNIMLAAGAALLLITFIFSLLFSRRRKRLLDEKPKRISGPGASFVTPLGETSDPQKGYKLNLALQKVNELKPGSPPSAMTDGNSPNSEMPRDSLYKVFIDQDDHPGKPKVDQAILNVNQSIAQILESKSKYKTEIAFDEGQDGKQDELTPVNIVDPGQRFDAVSLNYPEQSQDGISQAKPNHKSTDTPVEKEQFTDTISLKKSENYIDIETLLNNGEGDNPDDLYNEFGFDLGLDEFPDMLGENTAIDIDDDEYGISARLDLARAYLEIDDKIRSKKILMALIENSNLEQRQEIDKLLGLL